MEDRRWNTECGGPQDDAHILPSSMLCLPSSPFRLPYLVMSGALHVLVVDDDLAVCRILRRILSDEHYAVTTSSSVQEAFQQTDETRFDAFILDYRLSDGPGLEVAERVRAKGSEAPLILISGYGSSDLVAKAAPLRIVDVIEKPFSQETICGTLKKSLAAVPIVEERSPEPEVEPAQRQTPRRSINWVTMVAIAVLVAVALLATLFLLR
jgi:DNA-binding NtrC family response regulator